MKIAILVSALYKYYCYYYYYCTIKDGAQTYDFIADKSCLLLSIILKVLSGSEVIRIQGKCTKSYKNFWKDFVVKQNLTPSEGRNNMDPCDWLLESAEVESAYSLRGCSTKKSWRMIRRRRREGFCCLFDFFYGLVAGKYALICVHIFSGFA